MWAISEEYPILLELEVKGLKRNIVEINSHESPLHCPFCGEKVIDEATVSACAHTLYVATDEGTEFMADRLNKEAYSVMGEEEGYEQASRAVDFPNIIHFGVYVPPPGGMGLYVGFAPID